MVIRERICTPVRSLEWATSVACELIAINAGRIQHCRPIRAEFSVRAVEVVINGVPIPSRRYESALIGPYRHAVGCHAPGGLHLEMREPSSTSCQAQLGS